MIPSITGLIGILAGHFFARKKTGAEAASLTADADESIGSTYDQLVKTLNEQRRLDHLEMKGLRRGLDECEKRAKTFTLTIKNLEEKIRHLISEVDICKGHHMGTIAQAEVNIENGTVNVQDSTTG